MSVSMALNIRNEGVNRLAERLASRKHLNKTETLKQVGIACNIALLGEPTLLDPDLLGESSRPIPT